jgi:hypothetical protein
MTVTDYPNPAYSQALKISASDDHSQFTIIIVTHNPSGDGGAEHVARKAKAR